MVMACCVLHNLIPTRYPSQTTNDKEVDCEDLNTHSIVHGAWRCDDNLFRLAPQQRNTSMNVTKQQRNDLRNYFNSSVGQLHWQDDMI